MKNEHYVIKKHRGISHVIGSLVVLGIVSSVGSVILFNGMDEISAFTYDLTFHDKAKNEALREDLIFEHVRFVPNSNDVIIHLNNIGTIESVVNNLTIIKVDTQEMLVDWEEVDSSMLIKEDDSILVSADLLQGTQTWNDPYYVDSEYKISITTSKNNFFTTTASPFNT